MLPKLFKVALINSNLLQLIPSFQEAGTASLLPPLKNMSFKSTLVKLSLGATIAATALSAQALSLSEAYKLALQHDIVYAQAGYDLNAAVAEANQAYAAVLPTAGFTYNLRASKDLSLETAFIKTSQVTLAVQQKVFNVAAFYGLPLAQQSKQLAEANYILARQDLIKRTVSKYIAVLKAKQAYSLALTSANAARTVYNAANARFQAGTATQAERSGAQARSATAQARVTSAKIALDAALDQLKVIVGRQTKITQLNGIKADVLTALKGVKYTTNEETALQNNIQLKTAAMAKEVARLSQKTAQSAHYPTVDLALSLTNTPANQVLPFAEGGLGAHKPDKFTAQLTLNVPIFTGGAISLRSQAAASRYEKAGLAYELAYQNISNGFRATLTSLTARRAQISSLGVAASAASQAFRTQQALYQEGVGTLSDLTSAQSQYVTALDSLNTARFDYIEAVVALKQLGGNLTDDDIKAFDKVFVSPEKVQY